MKNRTKNTEVVEEIVSKPAETEVEPETEAGEAETTETENEGPLHIQTVKQPVTVIDLNTGEETKVTIEYNRYSAKSPITLATLEAAKELVGNEENQAAAFIAYASSQSYQVGKVAAFSGGNYLTPELKSRIVAIVKQLNTFADVSAKDCYTRWLAGYKAKKTQALQFLADAQAQEERSKLEVDFQSGGSPAAKLVTLGSGNSPW